MVRRISRALFLDTKVKKVLKLHPADLSTNGRHKRTFQMHPREEDSTSPIFNSVWSEFEAMLMKVHPGELMKASGPHVRDRGSDEVPLAICDDYLRRLFALERRLKGEYDELEREMFACAESIERHSKKSFARAHSVTEGLDSFFEPNAERDRHRNRIREIEEATRRRAPQIIILEMTFTAEVLARFPSIVSESRITLCSDWSLVAATEADYQEDVMRDVVRGLMDEFGGLGGHEPGRRHDLSGVRETFDAVNRMVERSERSSGQHV